MLHIVSISGGAQSAVTAERVINRYGINNTMLWFADTLNECKDLYRFLFETLDRWGISISQDKKRLMEKKRQKPDGRELRFRVGNFHYYTKGITPKMLAYRKKMVFNQKIAPCTTDLKIKPFHAMVSKLSCNFTIHLGYTPFEAHRIKKRNEYHRHNNAWRKPQGYHHRLYGAYEDYPLLWPRPCYDSFSVVRSWGIELPLMYRQGYDNNNCNGVCFKGGRAYWRHTAINRPAQFSDMAQWERIQHTRMKDKYTILRDQSNNEVKPVTLLEFESIMDKQVDTNQPSLFSCSFCTVGGE